MLYMHSDHKLGSCSPKLPVPCSDESDDTPVHHAIVVLDFSKAFDYLIPHNNNILLIRKMIKNNIGPCITR